MSTNNTRPSRLFHKHDASPAEMVLTPAPLPVLVKIFSRFAREVDGLKIIHQPVAQGIVMGMQRVVDLGRCDHQRAVGGGRLGGAIEFQLLPFRPGQPIALMVQIRDGKEEWNVQTALQIHRPFNGAVQILQNSIKKQAIPESSASSPPKASSART